MSKLGHKACPRAWRARGQAQRQTAVVSSHQTDSNTKSLDFQQGRVPLALQVHKRGKWCTIGKVTFLNGQRIFAIAHDQQAGVETHLSITEQALDFARKWGCIAVYFWRRSDLQVRHITMAELQRVGYWGEAVGNDAIREWYFPIASMKEAGLWARPKWLWADEVIQLATPEPPKAKDSQGVQATLFDVVGVA